MITRGSIICQEKKVIRKGMENPAINAYLMENKSHVPLGRRIATVRIVRVAFKFRIMRAIKIVTPAHRIREYRIEKLRR